MQPLSPPRKLLFKNVAVEDACSRCGGTIVRRSGKNGPFLAAPTTLLRKLELIIDEGAKMKVKILQAMTEKRLEKDVNEFVGNPQIRVQELQFAATILYFSVMISYEDI
jgi:hypothetical protein